MNDYIDQLIEDNPLISKEELHKQIKDNYDVSIKQIDDYVDQKKDFQKKAFEDDLADQKKYYESENVSIGEHISGQKERVEERQRTGLESIDDFYLNKEKALKARINERESDAKARALEDKAERAAFYGDRETALQAKTAANKEALNREQYGNLAMFFARLGTASPKSSGIGGVLGAGLEAAEATLPQAMETRRGYVDREDKIADRRELLAINKRGDKLQSTKESRAVKDSIDNFEYIQNENIATGKYTATENLVKEAEQRIDNILNNEFTLKGDNKSRERVESKLSKTENKKVLDNLMDMKLVKNMDLTNEKNAMLLKTANRNYENALAELKAREIQSDNLNTINKAALELQEAKLNVQILKLQSDPDFSKFQVTPKAAIELVDYTLNENYKPIRDALGTGQQKLSVYTMQAMEDVNTLLRIKEQELDLRSLTQNDFIKLVTDRVIEYVKRDQGTDTSSNNNLIKTTTEVEEVDELDTDINKIIGK